MEQACRKGNDGGFGVVFILSVLQPYGGVISVVQLANDLLLQGIPVKVVVLNPKGYDEELGLLTRPILFRDTKSLLKHFPQERVIVGTLWITMYHVIRLVMHDPERVPAYFVQDFEPLFHKDDDPAIREAIARTYKWTKCSFAKTPWIIEQVRNVGGTISLVPPALDLDLFYPRDSMRDSDKNIILTMLRPSTPQRGFDVAVQVLGELMSERGDIEIHTFGSSDEDLEAQNISFDYVNHGVVPNKRLPELYSKADVFAEFSHFHGFGRTIAEAMACETACVITDSGGVGAFVVDGENCLVSPPGDVSELKARLIRLLDDDDLRQRLGKAGRKQVTRFDRHESAMETLRFLQCCGLSDEIEGQIRIKANL
jgi:glycosyltransferase involved in cell wall biosynthesis